MNKPTVAQTPNLRELAARLIEKKTEEKKAQLHLQTGVMAGRVTS